MRVTETAAGKSDQDETDQSGLPVTIAATKLDGLVLALTPFHHSMNYRSAVLYGFATLVIDPSEKVWAMELITDHVVPGRWEHSRIPPDKGEMTSTHILRVEVVSASAKVRQGGPHDDRKDLRNDAMRKRVWTGVVPVEERIGEPVADETNTAATPEYLTSFVQRENAKRKVESVRSMEEPPR